MSRIFQKGFVSFAVIGPTLESAKFELNSLAQENKPINLLETELANGGRLGTLELEVTDHVKDQLQNKLKKYVLELSENFDKHFPDVPLLQSFSIFDPSAVPDKLSPEFKTHGIDSIKMIHSHFFGDSPAILDEMLAEYTLLKFHMLKWRNEIDEADSPTEWCLLKIMTMKFEFQQLCPNLTRIAEIVLALPVSNAWPERGASKVKLIKTSSRNLLKNDMLQGLMQIQINGPPICTKPCDKLIHNCVKSWQEAKPRRKLPKKQKAFAFSVVRTTESETQTASVCTDAVCVSDSVRSEEENQESQGDSEELRQRQIEQQLLHLKIARNLREAEQMAKVASSDSDEDD